MRRRLRASCNQPDTLYARSGTTPVGSWRRTWGSAGSSKFVLRELECSPMWFSTAGSIINGASNNQWFGWTSKITRPAEALSHTCRPVLRLMCVTGVCTQAVCGKQSIFEWVSRRLYSTMSLRTVAHIKSMKLLYSRLTAMHLSRVRLRGLGVLAAVFLAMTA